jgi:phenol hydroxylase P5 protein
MSVGPRFLSEIVDARRLTSAVRWLKLRAQVKLTWLPGQHVRVFGSEGNSGYYSIASAPASEAEHFELCVAERGGSVLAEARIGSRFWVSPPQGAFTRVPGDGSAIFVAVGTGISPVRAMIQAELADDPRGLREAPLVLIHGCRTAEELLFQEEFEALARARPRFTFEPTLTSPPSAWSGRVGRVQSHLQEITRRFRFDAAFLCGMPAMVVSASLILENAGLPREAVLSEAY